MPGESYLESVPGVIDCGKSLSTLEVRPTSLLLACGDGTAGLQDLTWTRWDRSVTAAGALGTAAGKGDFLVNDCRPDCAQGHDRTYPVLVTLSVVYSSLHGNYFGRASLKWQADRPPAGTKSTYLLPAPGGS